MLLRFALLCGLVVSPSAVCHAQAYTWSRIADNLRCTSDAVFNGWTSSTVLVMNPSDPQDSGNQSVTATASSSVSTSLSPIGGATNITDSADGMETFNADGQVLFDIGTLHQMSFMGGMFDMLNYFAHVSHIVDSQIYGLWKLQTSGTGTGTTAHVYLQIDTDWLYSDDTAYNPTIELVLRYSDDYGGDGPVIMTLTMDEGLLSIDSPANPPGDPCSSGGGGGPILFNLVPNDYADSIVVEFDIEVAVGDVLKVEGEIVTPYGDWYVSSTYGGSQLGFQLKVDTTP